MTQHPQRRAAVHELHARPFPAVTVPGSAAFLAITGSDDGPMDKAASLAHLIELLDRYGVPHPPPGANQHSVDLGRGRLVWEQHSEFATYMVLGDNVSDPAFGGDMFALFPADWVDRGGRVITSCLLRVEPKTEEMIDRTMARLDRWFVRESLAVAQVSDATALIAGDFRLDPADHIRFAIFAEPGIDPQRLGRIVQRLLEIETYKTMAMLALPVAQAAAREISILDARLGKIISAMAKDDGPNDEASLAELLDISAQAEHLASASRFRFGATDAYQAIVTQRLTYLRETRVASRQMFSEFMLRRFDPAMRTTRSVRLRLDDLAERAARAANLLRTRVNVATERQNRELLASMNQRADVQLRLQETVEGLSVVAIGYYAVGLLGYLGAPMAYWLGWDKSTILALSVLPVLLLVWWGLHRLKKRVLNRDR